MPELTALPMEVLAHLLAKLHPCEAIQLQRVSRSFRRAAAAGEELAGDVLDQLLFILAEGYGKLSAPEDTAVLRCAPPIVVPYNVQSVHRPVVQSLQESNSGQQALETCAARRWVAHIAAGVARLRSPRFALPWVIPCLVFCLPALEQAELWIHGPLISGDLESLLDALAVCPRLRALDLSVSHFLANVGDAVEPFPNVPAFSKLHSLTQLALAFDDPCVIADLVDALVPLTGLAALYLCLRSESTVVPAALGQLKGLQSLGLHELRPCVLEAGCLDLPNLQSLHFQDCFFEENAQVLPGVTVLQRLTSIALWGFKGFCFFDPGLVQLPQLRHMVMSQPDQEENGLGLFKLPSDMGALRASLISVDLSGLRLAHFPLAMTQLVGLECLHASGNEFAVLPAGIVALSRLTELRLGRVFSDTDPVPMHDARTLGDLSGFAALRELSFQDCQVMLCPSLLGAARHASLATLAFYSAYPALECAPAVLQLSRELWRLGRGSLVRYKSVIYGPDAPGAEQGRAACKEFEADLAACGQ